MHARSALFDLYGDALRTRGSAAPVAGLVRLLAPLGIAPPAVRTAVSRMVRQGWLEPIRLPGGPGYALTPRGMRRLADAADRVFRTEAPEWDGRWHVLVLGRKPDRVMRRQISDALGYLGYARLNDTTWIAPRLSEQLDEIGISGLPRIERFTSDYDGDAAALAARAWDLDGIARSYLRWLDDAAGIVQPASQGDEAAFAARFRLVHEWRKFLFQDPALPRLVLPVDWPGDKAASFFNEQSRALAAASDRFVESCLSPYRGSERDAPDG